MPQRRSAKKELRKTEKRKKQNLAVKAQVKKALKNVKGAVQAQDAAAAKETLTAAYKTLDRAAAKKVIHANKAARKKSRISKLIQSISKTKDS